jgi:hypothetical protein
MVKSGSANSRARLPDNEVLQDVIIIKIKLTNMRFFLGKLMIVPVTLWLAFFRHRVLASFLDPRWPSSIRTAFCSYFHILSPCGPILAIRTFVYVGWPFVEQAQKNTMTSFNDPTSDLPMLELRPNKNLCQTIQLPFVMPAMGTDQSPTYSPCRLAGMAVRRR